MNVIIKQVNIEDNPLENNWQQTFSPSVIVILSPETLSKCQFAKASHFIKVGLTHNKNCPF